MTHRARSALNLELPASELPRIVGFHVVRWGLLVGLAILTYLAYPVARGFDVPVLEVGRPSPERIDAPFEFRVMKTAAELEREAAALEATALPIYDLQVAIVDSVLEQTDSLFTSIGQAGTPEELVQVAEAYGVRLTAEEAAYLRAGRRLSDFRRSVRTRFRTPLRRGVAPTGSLEAELGREIVVRRNGAEQVERRDSSRTYQVFLENRSVAHPDPNSSVGDNVFVKLLNGLFRPTLVPNTAETQRRREELRANVDSVKGVVQAEELIIDRGMVVTPEVRDRLLALRSELLQRGGGRERNVAGIAGQVLTNAVVLAAFWALLMLYRPDTYRSVRRMVVMTTLFGAVVLGAAVNRAFIADVPQLIPIPFAAMLLAVLFGGRVATVAAIVLAVLVGSQAVYGGSDALFIALAGGVAAAVSVRSIQRRSQLLNAVVLVTGAFVLAGLAVELRVDLSWGDVGLSGLWGGLDALVSAALVFLLLPVFEAVARVTTDVTLLELSDPRRSLLIRLAAEAPGTYAHSIAMANICEAACNAVGANGLLARVGCYYHDIGKMKKPQYFVENQMPGVNPHDRLKPDVSAGIIRNHIRDGLALAQEHKLPDAIKAFIPEHHGTMEITYFLDRARNRNSDPDLDEEMFRYPGPRPQSVETAVTMLADGVEAALRVLDEPTPEKLRDAIEHIIRHRIEAGQLDDAPLTLAQLGRVKEELIRVTLSTYHNRIDYPAASGGIGAEWEAAPSA